MPNGLDQRITFQRKTRIADAMGGAVEAWEDVATVWANVRSNRGQEYLRGERVAAEAEYTFKIRYRSVNETQRIVWDGEAYNITQVEREGGRKLYTYIHAERGVGL